MTVYGPVQYDQVVQGSLAGKALTSVLDQVLDPLHYYGTGECWQWQPLNLLTPIWKLPEAAYWGSFTISFPLWGAASWGSFTNSCPFTMQ